jgi:ubiquinone/menaquinone biosynthesis C-methylase UbiE
MNISEEYRRQFAWRDWPTIFGELPEFRGHTILDLGCGVGDQSAELVARGARVVGFDMNDELIGTARAKRLANAEFHVADLRSLPHLDVPAHGIWCSFTAAYFIDFPVVLWSWSEFLEPGGWIALTEIDEMFGHEPVAAQTAGLLDAYVRDGIEAGRYDFRMGRKLAEHARAAGFIVTKTFTVLDRELAFDGPADPAVVEAWASRFDHMKRLQDFCGADYVRVRDDFLSCLTRRDHRSRAKVVCCIATKA